LLKIVKTKNAWTINVIAKRTSFSFCVALAHFGVLIVKKLVKMYTFYLLLGILLIKKRIAVFMKFKF